VFLVLVAVLISIGGASLFSVSRASADGESGVAYTVCAGRLDPAWTGNYRCDAPDSASGVGLKYVFINTNERAGCLDYADVWHNLINSWVCFPKNTTLGSYFVRQDGGWYRGAIRNNNSTYSGVFSLVDFFK
jgi:hypothetical protein